jgi:hypothetical protein
MAVWVYNRISNFPHSMLKRYFAKLKNLSVSLPFGLGSVEWESDTAQRKAAWSLWVELTTRIAFQPLELNQGLICETFISLCSLFETTRQTLKDASPDAGASYNSVCGISIAVLNHGHHPFLATWHPRLQAWEMQKSKKISHMKYEKRWTDFAEIHAELEILRTNLEQYTDALAHIAEVTEG